MSNFIRVAKITGVGCYDLAPKYSGGDGAHEDWEFMYIDSGSVNYLTETDSGVLKQGEILFHHPGEMHRTTCGGKNGASMITLIFECHSHAMRYFSRRAMKVPKNLMPILRQMIDECRRTYQAKQPLQVRVDAPKGAEQLIRNLLESFLILLMREQLEESSISLKEGVEGLNQPTIDICNYLKEHIGERVTLEELSERFHFGKSHMCVMFKKSMGTTIIDYHLNLKVAEAKRMLREEATTVREISERLGFDSPEYFSRCFFQRVGHSPRSFRNMLITGVKPKLK